MKFEDLVLLSDRYLIQKVLSKLHPIESYLVLKDAVDAGYEVEIPTEEIMKLISERRFEDAAIEALEEDLTRVFMSIYPIPRLILFSSIETKFYTTSYIAIERNNIDAMKFILRETKRVSTSNYNVLLRKVSRIGSLDIMKLLIEYGADDFNGAIMNTNDVEKIDYILGLTGEYEDAVLEHLIDVENHDLVKEYLTRGEDFPQYFLHSSCRRGSLEIVKSLFSTYREIDEDIVKFSLFNAMLDNNRHKQKERQSLEVKLQIIDYLISLNRLSRISIVDLALSGLKKEFIERLYFEGDLEDAMIDCIEEHYEYVLEDVFKMISHSGFERVNKYLEGRI